MQQQFATTGFRAPLLFSSTLGIAASAVQVVSKPQMNFRGENLVIDQTSVGPNCAVTMPTVGSIPQIIGGGSSTTVPGTLFSPNQCGALDFEMYLAEQGNDVTILATNNLTTLTLAFACAIFGHQVQSDGSPMPVAGVAAPGAYRR
jgi:hypothetical protein